MEFLIADTFIDSLAKMSGEEQKAVKTTAFDLQVNPAHPSLQFHKLDKPRDPNFWSIRVSRDVRLIVHKSGTSLLLCYVSHHDEAYKWAERRRLETHPKTGAAQLVEIRERVQEITIPKYVEAETQATARPLFSNIAEDQLLGYGVPAEWVDDVKNANEDTLLALTDHLPKEAAEALLELATGATPQISPSLEPALFSFKLPVGVLAHVDLESSAHRLQVLSVGKVDGLSPSRAAPNRGTRLQRPRPSFWFGRHRENDNCIASCGSSGTCQSQCSGTAYHLFRHIGERTSH
jgi:mRNA-degrading endonuclease RelE of RelBE toxin-antitoxin system